MMKKTHFLLYSAILAAFMLAGCVPFWQKKEAKPVLPNEFGKAALQMGIKTCAPLFSVMGQTLTANSRYSAKIIPDNRNSDIFGVTAIVGQTYGEGAELSKGTGSIYAAPVNGVCEGVLVRTLLMPQTCAEAARKNLPQGTQRQDDLMQTAVLSMPEGGTVTMIPAENAGCIVTMIMNLRDD